MENGKKTAIRQMLRPTTRAWEHNQCKPVATKQATPDTLSRSPPCDQAPALRPLRVQLLPSAGAAQHPAAAARSCAVAQLVAAASMSYSSCSAVCQRLHCC